MSAPPCSVIPRLSELDLVVQTARLRLRPLAATDADALWPFVSDPEFPRMMSWAAHADRKETSEFIAQQLAALQRGTDLVWAIEHEGQARGVIGLHGITWAKRAWRVDHAELGYWIAPPLWRQGLMTEAAHAATRFGFETLGLHKVKVACFADNVGSRRVIEKVGFRYVGREEEHIWRDGRWWSHLCYELTASEWSDVSSTMRVSRPPRT